MSIEEQLIKSSSVSFSFENPYVYASGLKGPVYCDVRKLWVEPEIRAQAIEIMNKWLRSQGTSFDNFIGLATAGITPAALLAQSAHKKFSYIRSKPKSHGLGNRLEGKILESDHCLLVEDTVNQGSSLSGALTHLKEEGFQCKDIFCVVSYDSQKSKDLAKELGFTLHSLTTIKDIAIKAKGLSLISKANLDSLMRWLENPKDWE